MLERIIGVMKLNVPTYEEIEHDEEATTQAAIVVVIAAIAGAVGAFLAARTAAGALDALGGMEGFEAFGDIPGLASALSPSAAAIQALISTLLSWVIWSGVTFFVGTKLFGGVATFGEMLRVIGFAQAPRILGILAVVPCLGFIGAVWALVCGFIAVRQGLDLDNTKAALTIVISWVVAFVIGIVLSPIYALLAF